MKQLNFLNESPKATGSGRKKPDGIATSDVVVTAYTAGNAEVFAKVMSLHVAPGAVVADVTFGKGVFWKNIPEGRYELLASDLKSGIDLRSLPYPDNSVDCVVLDPPYMEGLFRRSVDHLAGSGSHAAFRENYSNGAESKEGAKYHAAVVALYLQGAAEAARVLRPGGTLVVKCQDEVSANTQHLTHVEIINELEKRGYFCRDLFVVVRQNSPAVSRMKMQVHARKNHSYFLVFTRGENCRDQFSECFSKLANDLVRKRRSAARKPKSSS